MGGEVPELGVLGRLVRPRLGDQPGGVAADVDQGAHPTELRLEPPTRVVEGLMVPLGQHRGELRGGGGGDGCALGQEHLQEAPLHLARRPRSGVARCPLGCPGPPNRRVDQPHGLAPSSAVGGLGLRGNEVAHGDVDDDGGVIRRGLSFAGLAVHVGVSHRGGEGSVGVDEVDAHALVLVEHAGPEVPVGERVVVLQRPRHHVGESQRPEGGQGLTLRRGDMRGVGELGRVPHVRVGGRDVEVAADRQGPIVGQLGGEDLAQRGQPLEFVGVVGMVRFTAVGHVHRPHPHPGAGGRHGPGFRLGEPRPARQPLDHVREADPRQQRHPVPATQPMARDLVAQGVDDAGGEVGVSALRLLQAHHVRGGLLEPLHQPRHAGGHRVDVPRRDPHRPSSRSVFDVHRRGAQRSLSAWASAWASRRL
jgi:hypothetical protein